MTTKSSVVAVLVALALLGGLVACAAPPAGAPKQELVSILTGGTGGTFYIVGAGMGRLLSKYIPGVKATSENTAASIENVRLIAAKRATVALVDSSTPYWAYYGQMAFKDKPIKEVLMLGGGHAMVVHWVTLATSPIKTMDDLKGKRVSIGAPGSGTEQISNAIFEIMGLKRGVDFEPELLSFTETVAALKDGNVDAGNITAGMPISSVVDLTTSHDTRFIPLSDELLRKIVAQHPYWHISKIPAGMYRGVDKDVPALGTSTVWVAHRDTDPELVYNVVKTIYEHSSELAEVHPAGKEWTLDNAARGVTTPWHPGAEKYMREKGVLK